MRKITIGTDPELFLEKNGEIISAEGLIGGTKDKPKFISDEGHAIQEDNVMVEFNTPPANSLEEFLDSINYIKGYLNTLCEIYPGTKLNYSTSAKLDPKYLKTPQARLFGCEPSYNVYLRDISKAPSARSKWRSAGGHIHIGYENPNQEMTLKIIYAMDIILGLPATIMDEDTIRKESYGKAGEFRFKKYGCEYRTLSNFWIKNDELITWAYESTLRAVELAHTDVIDLIIEKYDKFIRQAINTSDKVLATDLMTKINDIIVKHNEELINN